MHAKQKRTLASLAVSLLFCFGVIMKSAGSVDHFIAETDDYGRNMLWDVARIESVYLLDEMSKRGFDVNHEDNQGNAILHYCLETSDVSTPGFTRKLEEIGVRQKNDSSSDNKDGESKRPVRLVSKTYNLHVTSTT